MKAVNIMITSILIFILVVGLGLAVLSIQSRKKPDAGLVDGVLRACPDTPNCVCSENGNGSAHIAPIRFVGTPESAFDRMKLAVLVINGRVVSESKEKGYLHAVFTTLLFRFKDDLELRVDPKSSLIHVRSASRVGYSDLGKNKKRVESLRRAFNRIRAPAA